jgi:hypothetical protein
VILPVLLVLLAGMASLVAALSAFIVGRVCGASVFRSLTCAAGTFAAAFTLALLALTFIASSHHGSHSSGTSRAHIASAMKNQGNERMASFPIFRVTYI